jgi:hypothetical protein
MLARALLLVGWTWRQLEVPVEASAARALLLSQHDRLRRLLGDTQEVADRVLAGEGSIDHFQDLLEAVRIAFAEHNKSEETLLEPILRLDHAWGPARIARMIEEHGAEHASFREALARPALDLAPDIADVIELIEGHIAAEERTFLSPGVLRDDVINTEDGD